MPLDARKTTGQRPTKTTGQGTWNSERGMNPMMQNGWKRRATDQWKVE
jgi:hypothetical protein